MKEIFIPAIHIPEKELYDEEKNLFIKVPAVDTKDVYLQLEHSLISISKWEGKWHKPFLGNGKQDKTMDEMIDYIRCMTINKVDPDVYIGLTNEMIDEVIKYISDDHTATWFSNLQLPGQSKGSNEVVTSEIIYYWMITMNIPVEFEKWHLGRLLTLIKVVNLKNQPKKKMSAKDAAAQRKAINNARRAKMHSKG